MEKIDLNLIRGKWVEYSTEGRVIAGGDDTVTSILLVAEKVNELIDHLTPQNR